MKMIKKTFIASLLVAIALAAVSIVMFATNPAPKVARLSTLESGKPYVVKLHARWCPVCALTKPAWSEIEKAYSASVNLVVFDFTNGTTTEESRSEAKRIGLDTFFEEHSGWTGAIAVLDGRTKKVITMIEGRRSIAEYRAAIDAALKSPTRR
jgi:thiol-disulfide isomerase/thioredoxin